MSSTSCSNCFGGSVSVRGPTRLTSSSHACPVQPSSRPRGAAGFTRSSTTDTTSWPGATMTAGAVAYQEGYNFSTRFPQIVAA